MRSRNPGLHGSAGDMRSAPRTSIVISARYQSKTRQGIPLVPFGTGGTRVTMLAHRERPGTPKDGRSTVGDTEAIQPPEDPWGSECLLVPRGGIEPPTRGFSVHVGPWRTARENRALS